MIGIYYIQNIINNYIYIGSSININIRISTHFNRLRKNNHINKRLQADFNMFGENYFKYGILEETTNEKCIQLEQDWISKYSKLYNIRKDITDYNISNTDIEKFKNRIIKLDSGCWTLSMKPNKCGYLRIKLNDKFVYCHRLSYMIFNNIRTLNLNVCHSCDNKICINPDHLFLGSCSDNHKDRAKKGIGYKISFDMAQKIRELYRPKSKKDIYDYLNKMEIKLSESAIDNILNNKTFIDINYIPKERHKVLTQYIVDKMKLDYQDGQKCYVIAKKYNFKYHTVNKVLKGKNW